MKKELLFLTFLIILLPIGAKENKTAQQNELNLIKQNFIQSLLSSDSETKSLVKSLTAIPPEKEISDQAVAELHQLYPFNPDKIEKNLQTIDTDGSWKDINYKDTKRSGWDPKIHAERILELAKLYNSPTTPYYQSEKIASAIHQTLGYWFTTKPVCLNWWYNQIGAPKTLGSAFLLFESQLTEQEKAEAIQVMQNSNYGMTGQNKVWLAGNVMIRGLLQNDISLVKAARDTIFSEIVTNQPEGIKSDWSFHQHGPQQQFGNYGLSFISEMSFYSGLFAGTSLTLDDKQTTILSSFLNEGYRWILWHGYMEIGALDRQLFHNAQIHKAFTIAFSATELAKSGFPLAQAAAATILKENYSTNTEKTFVGHKHFWDSDQTIHRRPRWMASVKMASKRVIGTELVNEDNLKGFYMADGATYSYIRGDEYLNIFPFWDWRKIPGITSYESTLPVPRLLKTEPRNESLLVGGVTNGNTGMTAMELKRNGLQAHKSWIFTDRFVLCLGADIKTDSALVVTTSIEQRLKKKDLLHLNGKQWNPISGRSTFEGKNQRFFHDQTGYIVLESEKCVAIAEKRTGSWSDFMGMYEPKPVEGEIVSLHLDHGMSPKGASYAYILLPATDRSGTAGFKVASVRIIRNDGVVQAASVPSEKTYWITTYKPVKLRLASGLTFHAETAGIYLIHQTKSGYQVWYSDPTHSLQKASATINGKKIPLNLSEKNKGQSVSAEIIL